MVSCCGGDNAVFFFLAAGGSESSSGSSSVFNGRGKGAKKAKDGTITGEAADKKRSRSAPRHCLSLAPLLLCL